MSMQKTTTAHTGLNRRQVLKTAAGATSGLAGLLLTKTPPLYAATRTVTMLQANHFVPASDENLRTWAKEFEKANKCRVKIDFIAHRDTYVKIAKEQETRQGHDIVFLFFSKPHLHHEDLETLDFMEDLGNKLGGCTIWRVMRGRSRAVGSLGRGTTFLPA